MEQAKAPVLVVTAFALLAWSSQLTADDRPQMLKGCICGIDDQTSRITVLPWEETSKGWAADAKRLTYGPTTTIIGETRATVAELKVGKTVRSSRLTGARPTGSQSAELEFRAVEIKRLSECIGRRAILQFTAAGGHPLVREIDIHSISMFAGEKLQFATNVETGVSQIVGSDDCPCNREPSH